MSTIADQSTGVRLAYHHSAGRAPTVMFLPGYASDMSGTKALALEAWARETGQAYLRFDYAGCGKSEGRFEDQTLANWRDDALLMLDSVIEGPVVLVGSSMGGWLMLLLALARPDRVAGLVGVAAAPDFTDWGFTQDEKMTILREGRLERPTQPGEPPMVTTKAFWSSGEALRVLFGSLRIDVPVRLLHGLLDMDVRWERSVNLGNMMMAQNVHTWLVKDGDHRLSRPEDIALLIRAVEDVVALCSSPSS